MLILLALHVGNGQSYKNTYSNGIYINSQSENSSTFIYIATPNLNNSVTLTLPINDGDNDQVLTTDGDGNLEWSNKESATLSANKFFDAYDAVGGVSINSLTTVSFATERQNPDPDIFELAGGEVTINLSDKFMFIYRVSVDNVNGSNRSDFISYIERDSGSGWSEVPGTRGHGYNRQASEGMSTVTVACVLDVENGDKYRVRAFRDSGSDDLETIADGSSITIFSIRNSGSGPEGAPGPEGPKGDPGTASDFISVYNSNNGGVTIEDSPETIPYNAIGNESGSIFNLENNQIEIVATDDFMIQYTVTLEQVNGNGRTTWQTWLEADTGSGFGEISGTRGSGYSRENAEGENTSMGQAVVSVFGSATFRVQAEDTGSNRDHSPVPNGCSMIIYTLRGGEQGPPGPVGSGTFVSGEGNTGEIAYWTGGSNSETITGNSNLFFDSGNVRLGVGTGSPSFTLDVADRINVGGNGTSGTFSFYAERGATDYSVNFSTSNTMNENTNYTWPGEQGDVNTVLKNDGSGNLFWDVDNSGSPSGSGVSGNGTGGQVAIWSGTGVSETITGDPGYIYDSATDRLGIGVASPSYNLDVSGDVNIGSDGSSGTLSIYSENGATDYQITITSSSTMTESTAYVLPGEQGANGTVLKNDGSGNLFWEAESSGNTIILGVDDDTQGAGTIDNYDIDVENSFIRIDATGNITLNGFESDNASNGQLFYVVNIGTGNITIVEDNAPDPDDGFITGGGSIVLSTNGNVTVIYDSSSGRWRVFGTK